MERPKLRKVDRIAHERDGQSLLVLRDPLGVAEPFAIDAEFTRVLDAMDGTKTVRQIRHSLLLAGALDLPQEDLQAFAEALQEGGWLDDDTFAMRWGALHRDFFEAPSRAARYADVLYPADRQQLAAQLDAAVDPKKARWSSDAPVRAIAVPHGPMELVGEVLDRTLLQLPAAEDVELVVVLGTDHGPGLTPYVATAKPFETPLGTVDVDQATFAALERRVGWVVREEIRHRDAHSIEWAAILLRHLYGDRCPPILPILCGQTVLSSADDGRAEAFCALLEGLCEDRNVLFWGSAELSHAGPAYGRPPADTATIAGVTARDAGCLDLLGQGHAQRLASKCSEAHPQGRPSGGPVFTSLSRLLPTGYRTEIAAHQTKQIPGEGDGWVGLAGVRFHPALRK